jgi:hypothetical protein
MTGYDGAHDLPPAFFGYNAALRVEQSFFDCVNKVTFAQSFPIETISRIEQDLGRVWIPERSLGRAKQDFDKWFSGSSILG